MMLSKPKAKIPVEMKVFSKIEGPRQNPAIIKDDNICPKELSSLYNDAIEQRIKRYSMLIGIIHSSDNEFENTGCTANQVSENKIFLERLPWTDLQDLLRKFIEDRKRSNQWTRIVVRRDDDGYVKEFYWSELEILLDLLNTFLEQDETIEKKSQQKLTLGTLKSVESIHKRVSSLQSNKRGSQQSVQHLENFSEHYFEDNIGSLEKNITSDEKIHIPDLEDILGIRTAPPDFDVEYPQNTQTVGFAQLITGQNVPHTEDANMIKVLCKQLKSAFTEGSNSCMMLMQEVNDKDDKPPVAVNFSNFNEVHEKLESILGKALKGSKNYVVFQMLPALSQKSLKGLSSSTDKASNSGTKFGNRLSIVSLSDSLLQFTRQTDGGAIVVAPTDLENIVEELIYAYKSKIVELSEVVLASDATLCFLKPSKQVEIEEIAHNFLIQKLGRTWICKVGLSDDINVFRGKLKAAFEFIFDWNTILNEHNKRYKEAESLADETLKLRLERSYDNTHLLETKLNIELDKLYQENSKEKLDVCMNNIKNTLDNIKQNYERTLESGFEIIDAFGTLLELVINLGVHYIQQFREHHKVESINYNLPPRDMSVKFEDGKIVKQTENKLALEWMLCSLDNWKLGMLFWIGKFEGILKLDIRAHAEPQINRVKCELRTRHLMGLWLHEKRLHRITAEIYNVRLTEINVLTERLSFHKKGIESNLEFIDNGVDKLMDKINKMVNAFSTTCDEMLIDSKSFTHSSSVSLILLELERQIHTFMKKFNNYLEDFKEFLNSTTILMHQTNVCLLKSAKLFSEGGFLSPDQAVMVSSELKALTKLIEARVQATVKVLKSRESAPRKGSEKKFEKTKEGLLKILAELKFLEAIEFELKKLELNLEEEKSKMLKRNNLIISFQEHQERNKNIHAIKEYCFYMLPKESRVMNPEVDECNGYLMNIDNILNNSYLKIEQIIQSFYNNTKLINKINNIPPNLQECKLVMTEKFLCYQQQYEFAWLQPAIDVSLMVQQFRVEACDNEEREVEKIQADLLLLQQRRYKQAKQNRQELTKLRKEALQNIRDNLLALYGHPRNKQLLEKLQENAQISFNDIKMKLQNDIITKQKNLEKEYDDCVSYMGEIRNNFIKNRKNVLTFNTDDIQEKLNIDHHISHSHRESKLYFYCNLDECCPLTPESLVEVASTFEISSSAEDKSKDLTPATTITTTTGNSNPISLLSDLAQHEIVYKNLNLMIASIFKEYGDAVIKEKENIEKWARDEKCDFNDNYKTWQADVEAVKQLYILKYV